MIKEYTIIDFEMISKKILYFKSSKKILEFYLSLQINFSDCARWLFFIVFEIFI